MLIEILLVAALSVSDCDTAGLNTGTCDISGSLDDTGATLDGSRTTPDGTLDLDGGGTDADTSPPCDGMRFGECQFFISGPVESAVTMADVAHFAPSVGSHLMEPPSWAVTGLPTNFFATTSTQALSGTVLGTPAEVRFTPVAWHWDYGDGTTRDSSTAGASWAALGVPEFDPTATSHVFARHGSYEITLAVDFAAEYRVGVGQWLIIPGTLPREAPPLRVLSRGAKTVLVDKDCRANPLGPGC